MKTILVVLCLAGLCALSYAADTSEVVTGKTVAIAKVRLTSVTLNYVADEVAVSCTLLDGTGKDLKQVALVDGSANWYKWGGTPSDIGKRALSLCRAQEGISK